MVAYIAKNEDGTWTEPLAMRSMWRGVWDWHTLSDAQRAAHGWYRFVEVGAAFDPKREVRLGPTRVLKDDVVTDNYEVRYDAATAGASVNAEHDRRVLRGRAFIVEGVGDVPLEGSERTQLVLLALKDTARDLKAAGVTGPVLMFTDHDNTDRRLTADQMIALVNAGKAWVQAVHEAKRALKERQDGVPADFAADENWPSLG